MEGSGGLQGEIKNLLRYILDVSWGIGQTITRENCGEQNKESYRFRDMATASGLDIPSYRGITWIYGEQGLVPETQPPSNGETEMRDVFSTKLYCEIVRINIVLLLCNLLLLIFGV